LFLFLLFAVVAECLFGSDKIYNSWHETQLERYLDDHSIPYPKPADRKHLIKAVEKNWDHAKNHPPYENWDEAKMKAWLEERKLEADHGKQSILQQVKSYWYDTTNEWHNSKEWVFNSWSDSDLKAFLDKNHIPNPNPKSRDSMLAAARGAYGDLSKKANDASHAPGDWLFESWSDSDLKAWCDARGVPVPQGKC